MYLYKFYLRLVSCLIQFLQIINTNTIFNVIFTIIQNLFFSRKIGNDTTFDVMNHD